MAGSIFGRRRPVGVAASRLDVDAFAIACYSNPSIVMGCAGMAHHRCPLEQARGIRGIDPAQAAVAMGTVAVR